VLCVSGFMLYVVVLGVTCVSRLGVVCVICGLEWVL